MSEHALSLDTDPEAAFSAPLAAPPHPETTASAPSASVNAGRSAPGASQGVQAPNEEDEEDDMPDYSTLEALLDARAGKASGASGKSASGSGGKDEEAAAFLPKRGEKDFEPTGFAGQAKALARSRATMYRAISGQRVAVARTMAHAVLDPVSRCATVTVTRRRIFEQSGITVKAWPPHMRPGNSAEPSRANSDATEGVPTSEQESRSKAPSLTQLFPEEALHLVERGSLILYLPVPVPPGAKPPATSKGERTQQDLVPLSIEQATALLLAPSSPSSSEPGQERVNFTCTREQYHVYVYLKRLGYIVQRAEVVEQLRAAAAHARTRQQVQSAGSSRVPGAVPAFRFRDIAALLFGPLGSLVRAVQYGAQALGSTLLLSPIRAASTLIHRLARGAVALTKPRRRPCGLLGLGLRTGQPDSYNEAFKALQFIPTYTAPAEKPTTPDLKPFFYAWRPATAYKRTDPPPPEFRVAIVNGAERNLLSLDEFAQLFEQVPLPPSEGPDKERAEAVEAQNRNAYGRQAAWAAARAKAEAQGLPPPPAPGPAPRRGPAPGRDGGWLNQILRFFWSDRGPAFAQRPRPPNPFPALKSGRRNMIVAVVDEGTTSIFRFGQSDFPGNKLAGV